MKPAESVRNATLHEILDSVEERRRRSPVVVGISGFGGSGKSTLARALTASVDRCARIRGDDFLNPERSHQRSANWNGVDRTRLRREVLDPFRAGESGMFQRFDWSLGRLGEPEGIPDADVLVVDLIGLFHPELDGALDLRIWVDFGLAESTERGKKRDRELGRDHDRLWNEVWVPNEKDFVDNFSPRSTADLLFDASKLP